MKRYRIGSLLVLLFLASCSTHTNARRGLQSGDMLFLDLDCGEICDAIEDATLEQFAVSGPRLSHVGIVEEDLNGRTYVWESWPPNGVMRTPLAEFLSRVKAGENQAGGYYVGRIKKKLRMQALMRLQNMKRRAGSPYDDYFLVGNKDFYCSELVAESFRPWFRYQPMYFGKAGTATRKVWEDYYAKLNKKVPDGKSGISPLGIYLAGREKYFQ